MGTVDNKIEVAYGGQMDTIKDDAEIYEILLKQFWAEWDHIKRLV